VGTRFSSRASTLTAFRSGSGIPMPSLFMDLPFLFRSHLTPKDLNPLPGFLRQARIVGAGPFPVSFLDFVLAGIYFVPLKLLQCVLTGRVGRQPRGFPLKIFSASPTRSYCRLPRPVTLWRSCQFVFPSPLLLSLDPSQMAFPSLDYLIEASMGGGFISRSPIQIFARPDLVLPLLARKTREILEFFLSPTLSLYTVLARSRYCRSHPSLICPREYLRAHKIVFFPEKRLSLAVGGTLLLFPALMSLFCSNLEYSRGPNIPSPPTRFSHLFVCYVWSGRFFHGIPPPGCISFCNFTFFSELLPEDVPFAGLDRRRAPNSSLYDRIFFTVRSFICLRLPIEPPPPRSN